MGSNSNKYVPKVQGKRFTMRSNNATGPSRQGSVDTQVHPILSPTDPFSNKNSTCCSLLPTALQALLRLTPLGTV